LTGCGIIPVMERWNGSYVVVGVGVALIFALAMIIGDFFGGLLGMFACALLAGVACGALVANDERKTWGSSGSLRHQLQDEACISASTWAAVERASA
jgi:hypothetical protein